jgi:YD repeat-containing protein
VVSGVRSRTQHVPSNGALVANDAFAETRRGRLVQDADFAYGYDAEGRQTSRTDRVTGEITTYVWNAFDELVRVEHPDGTTTACRRRPAGGVRRHRRGGVVADDRTLFGQPVRTCGAVLPAYVSAPSNVLGVWWSLVRIQSPRPFFAVRTL